MKKVLIAIALSAALPMTANAFCSQSGYVPDGWGNCVKSQSTKNAEAQKRSQREGTYGRYGESHKKGTNVDNSGRCTKNCTISK